MIILPLRFFSRLCLTILLAAVLGILPALADPDTLYPQPDPSADEQAMLEMINRARANPPAEGVMLASVTQPDILSDYTFFAVNPALLVTQFAGYAATPPLAMNPLLMSSALRESTDMAVHGVQTHDGTDGSTFDGRISATGYDWAACGENIYGWVFDPFFAHVGFNADWGVPSLDHRANIMGLIPGAPQFREIGISYVGTTFPTFGPYVVTEDFATPADSTVAYVLGVVYADGNNNGSYDQGEGLAGVTVSPDSGTYYAVTASAGGFVIPLPATGSGTLTLTASGGGLGGPRIKSVAWTAGTNVKVDFTTADPVTAIVQPPPPAPTPTPTPVASLPVLTLSVAAPKARAGTGLAGLVTVSRAGSDTSADLWVPLHCTGTAVAGVDYTPLPARVKIPAGADSVDVEIDALGGTPTATSLNVLITHDAARFTVATGQGWGHIAILAPRG